MISKKRKNIKSIVLYSLVIVMLAITVYFVIWPKYLKNIVKYTKEGKQENSLIKYIKINGTKLPFDKNTNTFYYPINVKDCKVEKKLNIEISSSNFAKHVIDGKTFSDNIELNTIVDFNKEIEIYSSSTFYYSKCKIKFTNLPIATIDSKLKDISINYLYSSINIIDPDYEENESEYCINSEMKIRTRGNSSSYEDKKSYRVSLCDNNNEKKLSLLGMRTDSDWIFDSLVSDTSKIRNGLSYDIWNLVNEDIDENYRINFNWKLIELFTEDEYVGLYVLKEPIDEKTLNLKETSSVDSGILLKGIDHSMADFTEEKIKNVKIDTYYGFEMKYPKGLKDNSQYWYRMLSKMKDYYSSNVTDEVIENTFYMDNIVNYRLFVLALKALDNYEPKNVYFSMKDFNDNTKILLTPWDLDLTFGIQWDEEEGPTKFYDRVEEIEYINIGNSQNYKSKLKERWQYLRKKVFNEDKINNLIDSYYKELTLSDAINREYSKWGGENISVELQEIKTWCNKRFSAIDKYIDSM